MDIPINNSNFFQKSKCVQCCLTRQENIYRWNKVAEEQVDVEYICLYGYIRNTPQTQTCIQNTS